MSGIEELEGRISAALDRIGGGVEKVAEARLKAQAEAHAEELAAERAASATLEERVRAIKERQETMVAALQDEVRSLKQALTETDGDLQRLRAVNAELRASNAALRNANAKGLADADLVNGAMEAELAALRALDETNRAEIDRALALLEPLAEETADA